MLIVRALKDGFEAIIIALRKRIVLVIMTPRTFQRETHDRRGDCFDLIGDDIDAVIDEVDFSFRGRIRRDTKESGGNQDCP